VIVVSAGLIEKDGKLLITQRPPNSHGALKWEFPGGKLEQDEDPRECLRREVMEELKIQIEVGEIVDVVFHRYPERSVLVLFYACRWVSGDPVSLGVRDFAWCRPQRLNQFDFLEADLDFIEKLSKKEKA
jgi:8-oxo-dGTP diphosphatase